MAGEALGSTVLYGVISISITFFNKAVLSVYKFNFPFLMSLLQMLLSLLFLTLLKKFKKIDYPDWDIRIAKRVLPLSFSFFSMVLTGLSGLYYLNVPMYNAIRRTTTFVVMIVDYILMRKTESLPVIVSVLLMVLGAIVAGMADYTFNLTGYIITFLNCFCTAGYLVYAGKYGKEGLNSWGLMFYNNILSIPFVFMAFLISSESSTLANYEHLTQIDFQVCLFVSSVQAFMLNYAIFLCTNLNSPLTTSVVGQIKNVVTTGAGMFVFGDVIFSAVNTFGLILGTAASVWYSYLKFLEKHTSGKAAHASSASSSASAMLPLRNPSELGKSSSSHA